MGAIIIVPPPLPPRDCVVVSGKRYCEDTPLTKADVGFGSAAILIVLVWGIGMVWAFDSDLPPLGFAILFLPFLLGILISLT